MKLNQVLSHINQVERAKFVSCLDRICSVEMSTNKKLAKSISQIDGQIKNASESEITQLFKSISQSFKYFLNDQLSLADAQMIMVLNILTRDGNSVVRASWLETLYEKEWKQMSLLAKEISSDISAYEESDDFNEHGKRLSIYRRCFQMAYTNDERINREAKVSDDERSVLNVLAEELGISVDESFAIEQLDKPAPKDGVINAVNSLREIGVLFVNRKRSEVIIADEVISMLHEIQHKELPDKYTLRLLRSFSDGELSNILKNYGKRIRGVERKEKIKTIIHSRISVSCILKRDLYGSEVSLNQRKERLKSLINDLNISAERIGTTLDDRVEVILNSLKNCGEAEFNYLSATGFKELFTTLKSNTPKFLKRFESEFEIENVESLDTERLRLLGISPLDVLYLFSNEEVKTIRDDLNLSKRGEPRQIILENFASANDKFIEHYAALACRDFASLKNAGVEISESEIGIKFEEITKSIFEELNLNIDEDLRKEINTSKDKIDIVVSLSELDVIICEAKTSKNGDFSKYSATSRQIKSYVNRCESYGKRVAQVLIVAPTFSEDFVESSEMDTEVNISLLEANGLKQIYDAYKSRRNPKFSPKLLTKGGLLKADRIAKTI